MIKTLALTFLFLLTSPQDLHKLNVENYLQEIGLRHSSGLEALASWQVKSLQKNGFVTEFDLNNLNFAQRLEIIGFSPIAKRFDEFYFKSPYPNYFFFESALDAIENGHYTQYGVAIAQEDGYYYLVITVGNFNKYA